MIYLTHKTVLRFKSGDIIVTQPGGLTKYHRVNATLTKGLLVTEVKPDRDISRIFTTAASVPDNDIEWHPVGGPKEIWEISNGGYDLSCLELLLK
jgi:hypothetical protein